MDQRREKEGVVILSHFDKIYATHFLKLGMNQRKEKEGVVILSHLTYAHQCNSPAKDGNGCVKKKREWLFLVILTISMQLTC